MFKGFRPFKNVPRIPFVKLLYVNFNKNVLSRATVHKKARKAWRRIDCERVEANKKLGEEDPGNVADEENSSDSKDIQDGM